MHVKDIFKKQDTGNPVSTEGPQGSKEGTQGSMRAHFKPKEQGWDKEQDDVCKEKLTEYIEDKYLPLAIVESVVFREMIGALYTNEQIPAVKGIKRNLLVFFHETLPLVRKIRTSRIVRGGLEH